MIFKVLALKPGEKVYVTSEWSEDAKWLSGHSVNNSSDGSTFLCSRSSSLCVLMPTVCLDMSFSARLLKELSINMLLLWTKDLINMKVFQEAKCLKLKSNSRLSLAH